MKRLIDWHLAAWKSDPRRKPLVLKGARQVGKTHAVRELGKSFSSFVEVNFEQLAEARTIFEKDLLPKRLIWELSLLMKQEIIPGQTLLFFDEIQGAPQAILSLRYFFEQMPELHVIAAGSLLDFALEKIGMPVGRVTVLYMYPLSFMEFLAATGEGQFIDAILRQEPLSDGLHRTLNDLVAHYLVVGGMPEVVRAWVLQKDARTTRDVQKELIEIYRLDFPKYANKYQTLYVEVLFNQVPHFISQQFKYSLVHGEYKKRELAPCLDLLRSANVVTQVTHSASNGLPLGAEVNLERFKVIFLDVGIAQAILGLDLATWILSPEKDLVNRGTAAEAFVGQELLAYAPPKWKADLYFWKRESSGALAEVDYVIESNGAILPIEVKSGHGSTLRSMHQFLDAHPNSPKGMRFWSDNYLPEERIDSRPLYAIATLASPDQQQAMRHLLN